MKINGKKLAEMIEDSVEAVRRGECVEESFAIYRDESDDILVRIAVTSEVSIDEQILPGAAQ